MMLREFKN